MHPFLWAAHVFMDRRPYAGARSAYQGLTLLKLTDPLQELSAACSSWARGWTSPPRRWACACHPNHCEFTGLLPCGVWMARFLVFTHSLWILRSFQPFFSLTPGPQEKGCSTDVLDEQEKKRQSWVGGKSRGDGREELE